MRTLCRNIFYVLVAVAAMLVLSGCIERIESFEEDNYKPTSYLSFKASINVDAKSLITRGAVGSYDFEEEDWDINFMDETSTKTVLYSSLDSIKAGVFGYVYNGEWNNETQPQPLNYIKDDEYFVDGDIMSADTPIKWSLIEQSARELSAEEENSKLRIYA